MSDIEEQNDEICVLKSIYTNEELQIEESNSNCVSGQFLAFVPIPSDFKITYKLMELEGNTDEIPTESIPISFLPPILLSFKLPPNYPSKEMPDYQISCPWLTYPKMKILCKKLDELWKENKGMVILYIWTQFLKEESMSVLEIGDTLDLTGFYVNELKKFGQKSKKSELLNDTPEVPKTKLRPSVEEKIKRKSKEYIKHRITRYHVNMHLHQYLRAYNEDRAKTVFLKGLYLCSICYTEKLGLNCIQFKPCDHVYCRDCIRSYFEVRIMDNSIQTMPCPFHKCASEASQNQIREVVGANLYSRYDKQLLAATLDKMQDITYCPRTVCGCPVMRDTDEKMAVCPSCSYVFCVFCKMTYHGVEPCRLKNEEKMKLLNEYEGGDENTKSRLEKRYGKKQIQLLLQDIKSESWISTNSKPCPNCNIAIEKIDGCNKMSCWKCNTFFCWLCLSVLDPHLPYFHFLDPQSKCHSQLFEGIFDHGNQDAEELEDDFLGDDDEYYEDEDEDDDDANFYFLI